MKLPINLTPAKALEILRAYFPKADGYSIALNCSVREYDFSKAVDTEFDLRAWLDNKPHISASGPTLGSALSLILEGREPVKLFTEDPEAVSFFKSAEESSKPVRWFKGNIEPLWKWTGERGEWWNKDGTISESYYPLEYVIKDMTELSQEEVNAYFGHAEDDAEALRLSALSAGAKVEHERFFHNGVGAVWRCLGETCAIWHKSDPVFTRSALTPNYFNEDQEITRAEALKLTGGAL